MRLHFGVIVQSNMIGYNYSNDKIKREIILIIIPMKPFQTIDKNVYQQFAVWINNVFKSKNKQETITRHF